MCYQYKSQPRHNLRDMPKIPLPWKSSFIFQYFFKAGAKSRQFISVFRKQIHWFGRWRMRNNIAKCPCPFPLPLEERSCTLPQAASSGPWRARTGMTSASQHRGLPELCFTLLPSREMLKKSLFWSELPPFPRHLGATPNMSGATLKRWVRSGHPWWAGPAWCCAIHQNCINPTNAAAIWSRCRAGSCEPPWWMALGID